MPRSSASDDPHRDQPVLTAGTALSDARAAMILVHGRGASAEDILGLAGELRRPELAYLAPQAAGHTWYPYSFLVPTEQNEPYLSSALTLLGAVVERVAAAGISAERLLLLGFSQGACLTLEFAARNARRYGGVIALTGGLIGTDVEMRAYPGSLDGTPVFIGSADPDPHIPVGRVHDSAHVLERLGATVTTRLYPGIGHTVNRDEVERARMMIDGVLADRQD